MFTWIRILLTRLSMVWRATQALQRYRNMLVEIHKLETGQARGYQGKGTVLAMRAEGAAAALGLTPVDVALLKQEIAVEHAVAAGESVPAVT